MREQIAAKVVGGHVGGLGVHLLDELRQDRVGRLGAGKRVAHQRGGPEGGELR
jgi:hypothetical protein